MNHGNSGQAGPSVPVGVAGDVRGFVGVPTQAELERSFFLDDEDLRAVGLRRGDHNRLGYAIQLVTVRTVGAFLPDPTDVPTVVIDHVAAQIGVADPSCLKLYLARRTTKFEHAEQITTAGGYVEFADAQEELVAWIADRVWTTGDGPSAVHDGALRWLRAHRVLLPGPSRLDRVVARVREETQQRLFDTLAGQLDHKQAQRLDGLLEVPGGSRVSHLDRLRTGPTAVSGKAMAAALARVAEIEALGFTGAHVVAVPPRRAAELARWGMTGKAPALRRHPYNRRLATMLATVVHLRGRAVDDALELFDTLMGNDLMARARRQSNNDTVNAHPAAARNAAVCAAAAQVLLEADGWDGPVGLDRVWAAITPKVSRAELAAAVAGITAAAPPPGGDPHGQWRSRLVERWALVRRFLPALCQVIQFQSTPAAAPVLRALAGIPDLLDTRPTRKVPAGYVNADRIVAEVVPPGWWRPLVYPRGRPEGTVDRASYVFCVLEALHQGLRRRDIHARASTRWADPVARLLPADEWNEVAPPVLNALQLPADPDPLVAEHTADLHAAWTQLSTQLAENPDLTIGEDGRLHTTKLEAMPDPDTLIELHERAQDMIPRVDIGEVITDVMACCPGFAQAFTPASGGTARLSDLNLSLAAALTANALNIGIKPVTTPSVKALTRDRITHVDQNYLRAETYAKANAHLIAAQADIPLAQSWGGGLVAAADGIRFVVPIHSIDTRPNPKYFGRGRGATLLNLVNDQAVGIAGMVLSGTPRDSLHLIDLIYRQDGGARPEIIISDTGSYSDMVFGLLRMLGFDYRPQLADLPDAKLWRIDPAADYGQLDQAARGRIDTTRITSNWAEMLRIAGSIHTGAVSAHDVLRMLTHGGTPTRVGDALAHYGRIFKTLHVLSYVANEPYRRQIKAMRNLQEGRHELARRIFHGRKGHLRQAYREGMENQMGALGLVVNAVTLWNTIYLNDILDKLRADGHHIDPADQARLSAYIRTHINVDGHYAFTLPDPDSARRPLRDPDEPDDQ